MDEFATLLAALHGTGADRSVLEAADTAHLVVAGRTVLSSRTVPGLAVTVTECDNGIAATVTLQAGITLTQPVHLCFGVVHPRGLQTIRMAVRLEAAAHACFIAHCLFPNAEEVRHEMDARVEIGAGASLDYREVHYHGPYGGTTVVPRSNINVGHHGRYLGTFTLVTGRVGQLELDTTVHGDAESLTELTVKVRGAGNDRVRIDERITLAGENARSLIKTRIALQGQATAEVTGMTAGEAAGARGHLDCMEVVQDQAVASAVPMISVTDPLAKVTHEAAIGTVDRHQLETLMAHGLTPEEAVDVIVKGILN